MRNIIKGAISAALLAGSVIAVSSPAQAQYYDNRYDGQYYAQARNYDGDYGRGHDRPRYDHWREHRWEDARYRHWQHERWDRRHWDRGRWDH